MEPSQASSKVKSSCLCGRKKNSSMSSENTDIIAQQADDYLESLVDKKEFSGSVLLARNNQIILIKGYGCSEYICQDKNTSQTIYRIGSITKPFTALIVLKLHEQKKINLEDKLSVYYPDYPNSNKITIKHLLGNASGIENYTEMDIFEKRCHESITVDELIDMFKNEPLKFKPGTQYSYSNSNYILLGLVIEKVTGKSFESNLRELIIEPCCMNDTGYECDCDHISNTKHNQRAFGYVHKEDSNIFETCRYINMSTARSAGGIYSTVEDLYRLDRCLYGDKLLNNRSKKLLFKPVKEHYALGWEVSRTKHRRLRHYHSGEIFGFTSFIARFPKDNACIIILSNLEGLAIHDIVLKLTDILFQQN